MNSHTMPGASSKASAAGSKNGASPGPERASFVMPIRNELPLMASESHRHAALDRQELAIMASESHAHAAIDRQYLAIAERRGVGRKVNGGTTELLRIAPAVERRATADPVVELPVVAHGLVGFGRVEARADAIHIDAHRPELDGK